MQILILVASGLAGIDFEHPIIQKLVPSKGQNPKSSKSSQVISRQGHINLGPVHGLLLAINLFYQYLPKQIKRILEHVTISYGAVVTTTLVAAYSHETVRE